MMSEDNFHYALENTRVIVPPQQRLATFGTTHLHYHLVTEDMDSPDLIRVREGRIEAERPQILSPQSLARLMIEGFGEQAQAFAEHISAHASRLSFLKYGFHFRKNEIQTHETREPFDAVLDKIKERLHMLDQPMTALLTGVDDAWEVCLLKFTIDFIQHSAPGQIDDLRKKGLLGGGE